MFVDGIVLCGDVDVELYKLSCVTLMEIDVVTIYE